MKKHTLNELFSLYLTFTEFKNSKQTIQTNKSYYKNYLEPRFGNSNLEDLTLVEYQSYFNSLLTQGLKPKTVKNIKAILSAMYTRGIKNQYCDFNPAKYIELPKFDNTRYFTHSLITQLNIIHSIKNHDEKPYNDIFFFLLQGRRLSEVLKIKWSNIDLNEAIYTIPFNINKAKKSMSYKMTDELRNRLYYIYYSSIEKKHDVENGYVFINPQTGTRYKDIRRAWKRFLDSNNLPKIRVHDIRHLIGTYCINHLQLPIEQVSHTLGHSDIKITQKYITKVPETAKNTISKLLEVV